MEISAIAVSKSGNIVATG
jgi:WD40 repeat protein